MNQQAYILPNGSKIEFSANVIQHFKENVQLPQNKKSREAGGQLFSPNPNEAYVYINTITGPNISDKRSKYSWKPDTNIMSSDRDNFFKDGMFVVGLWHTHPERYPQSSSQDKVTCLKHLNLLDQSYQGILLITVGYEDISVEYLEKITNQWHKLNEV